MALVIDESLLPATLTGHAMSDEEFAEFCAQYADDLIEMTAGGEIIIMLPNCSLLGARNQKIGTQLDGGASRDHRGIVTDAASGFRLPNGARRSPDAAWTSKSRILALDQKSLRRLLASLPGLCH